MTREPIQPSVTNGHYRIVLDVAGKPNPIDAEMMAALDDALTEIERDEDIVVASIVGHGSAFSVGADLETIADWIREDRWEDFVRFLRDGQSLTKRIDELSVPTIAGINGYALGGGLEIALACDVRIAAESATLGLPESTLGMIPGWGGTQRLPAVVGASAAKDLALTGRQVDANEALDLGLVGRTVPDGELSVTIDDYAKEIADKPPATIGYLMDAIDAGVADHADIGFSHELLCDLLASFEDETERRIDSFLEE